MRIVLRKLECIRTKSGEPTEEPYLCVRLDDSDAWITVGPYSMRDGETEDDLFSTDLVGDDITIVLREDDYDPSKWTSGDDKLGGIRLIDLPEDAPTPVDADYHSLSPGPWVIDLPPAARYGPKDRHYRLHFDVSELRQRPDYHPIQAPYCLELVSLECVDAQEWKDYVFIKVNGVRMFRPRRMRNPSTTQLDLRTPIFWDTRIQLWEEDEGNRNDLFGEFRLFINPATYDFTHDPEPHRFHRDEGIVGDATYVLTYRVTERPIDIDGNRTGCI